MSAAQLWTILGVMLVAFTALLATMIALFLHLDSKMEFQGREIRDEMKAQGREIREIKGMVKAVLELVPHPSVTGTV